MQMYKYAVSMQQEKLWATCLSLGGLRRAAGLETVWMNSSDGLNKGLLFFFSFFFFNYCYTVYQAYSKKSNPKYLLTGYGFKKLYFNSPSFLIEFLLCFALTSFL